METTPPVNLTSVAEKLRAMEALWAGSSRDEAQFEPPAWHGDVLHEREENIKTGRESFMDWEAAKKQLRERLT
jgi:Putative addiction module component